MMNKSKLKTFAITARIDLLGRVRDRAAFYGLTKTSWEKKSYASSDIYQKPDGSLLSRAEITQRERLIQRLSERGFDYVIEEAAYTWFNRLIAIRYMQQHMLLPLAVRVLPQAPGQLPQIIEEAHLVELPGLDTGRVLSLIEASRTEALYKYLLITLCNALNASLPQMFETISDYTELLFPDNLLRAESALGLLADLEDDNWQEIQVIGWLYQYYNTELKDETFELLKKNVKITKDRIGAATQLFTPEWIVRYMVQNSLGRLWLEGHPNHSLRARWRYYLDEAAQEPEVEAQLQVLRAQPATLRPEDIRLIDPCMGSGHILVYAFDLLMDIYRSVGYTDKDAVESILTHNLYGLDIDDRAAQLAYFALMMKACTYDKRFLKRGIQPRVCAIQESNSLAAFEGLGGQLRLDTLCLRTANELITTFKDAKIYGSLIPVNIEGLGHVDSLITQLEEAATKSLEVTAWLEKVKNRLRQLAQQAAIMQTRYDVVITNPPYMGSSGMDAKLSQFVKDQYPDSKSDLFSAFIERGLDWIDPSGFSCMVTMQSWMFLSSFETLRKKILTQRTIVDLLHMENMVMGIAFGTAVANLRGQHINGYSGCYNYMTMDDLEDGIPLSFPTLNKRNSFARQDNFSKIPGAPVAYWVGEATLCAFTNGSSLKSIADPKVGLQTGENERFLRLWTEVDSGKISFTCTSLTESITSQKKWFPYNKGGDYRKWYGNNDYLVNWENDGNEIRNFADETGYIRSRAQNTQFYFKPSITWSKISSGNIAFRFKSHGHIFDVAGTSIFADNNVLMFLLGFNNSIVALSIANILSPTLNYEVGHIASFPIIKRNSDKINQKVEENIAFSRIDWDTFETSWDFKCHPLL